MRALFMARFLVFSAFHGQRKEEFKLMIIRRIIIIKHEQRTEETHILRSIPRVCTCPC
jgi:hypothetical protein